MVISKINTILVAIGLPITLFVGGLITMSYNKDKIDVKDEVVVKPEAAQPTQSTPIPKPLPFKCGNPKDIVVGTRVKDTCEDCVMPPGSLGTVIESLQECKGGSFGFIVLYDNYRSPNEGGGWCVAWTNLTILSQPTCEN